MPAMRTHRSSTKKGLGPRFLAGIARGERERDGELTTMLFVVGDSTEATRGLAGRKTSTTARVSSSARQLGEIVACFEARDGGGMVQARYLRPGRCGAHDKWWSHGGIGLSVW